MLYLYTCYLVIRELFCVFFFSPKVSHAMNCRRTYISWKVDSINELCLPFLAGNFSLQRAHKAKKTFVQCFLTMAVKAIVEQLHCAAYSRSVTWVWAAPQVKMSLYAHSNSTYWQPHQLHSQRTTWSLYFLLSHPVFGTNKIRIFCSYHDWSKHTKLAQLLQNLPQTSYANDCKCYFKKVVLRKRILDRLLSI